MSERQPIFNVPAAVVAVLAVLVGVHAARLLLSPETDAWLVISIAFIPGRYAGYGPDLPGGELAMATSLVTHMLAHGDATHLLFNTAWLLAFGGVVAERIGGLRFLALSLFTGIAGALAFMLAHPGALLPMIGASGAVSGLMGGTMRFLYSALDRGGLWRLRLTPHEVPLMPLVVALGDQRILSTTAIWLAINLLAIVGFAGVAVDAGIAWEAHVGGYLAGLLAYGLFDTVHTPYSPDRIPPH
jgi:membrane associated rhomboid family serine protease